MSASAAIASLRKLQATLQRLRELPRRTAEEAAPEITRLLQQQFAAGVDPYGRPWVPLRPATLRRHGPPALTSSGTLRDGTKALVMSRGAGLHIVAGAPYGAFHQVGFRSGHRRVPARKIFPERGLPASWRRALDNAARRVAAQAHGGA